MSSVPERATSKTFVEILENIEPRQRAELLARIASNRTAGLTADDLLARMDPSDRSALAQVMARLATSYVRRYQDAGGTVEDLKAGLSLEDLRARPAAPHVGEAEPPAPKTKRRQPRPSPSRLAKWEAAWQAEQDAEAER